MTSKIIEPRIPKGTRDFLPEELSKRNYVMEKMKSVFISFGYDTIETPVIEYAETLLGKYGEEASKLVYQFDDFGGRKLALRYDQTVPFARLFAANYQHLPLPFKRYQISRVWRADKPAKGRYREFYQCDVDIVGSDSLLAEGEITKLMSKIFTELGFKKYQIKFNSRKLINSVLESLGVLESDYASVIRIIDKLDKIGLESVKSELDQSFPGNNFVDNLVELIGFEGSNEDKIKNLASFDTEDIENFLEIAASFDIPKETLVFDPGLARGLDYYTGIIWEVFLPEADIGAVCAGGRYDDLTSMFIKQQFGAVGVAFGFDRIISALEELNLLERVELNSQIMIVNFGREYLRPNLTLLSEVQLAGLNAEIYFDEAKLNKQLKYADKKNIPLVLIQGEGEVKESTVSVKDMHSGKQKTLPRAQLTSYLKGLYNLK
jgi:histidyl-tRNA synthetase